MRAWRLLALVLLILAVQCVKAESADFTFHVTPINSVLHPGDKIPLTILVENQAELKNFPVNVNTSQAVPMLTTAYNVRVELMPYDVPITVENVNPQLLASIPNGGMMKAVFIVKVWDNASEGVYSIPVRIRYVKYDFYPSSTGLIVSSEEDTYTAYFKIKIVKRDYDFSIKPIDDVAFEGRESVIVLEVTNTGRYEMKNVTAILNTTPPLKPNPKGMTAFLGDLKPGERRRVEFKVFCAEGAFNGTYPANVVLAFTTESERPLILKKSFGIKVEDGEFLKVKVLESLITQGRTLRVSSAEKMNVPAFPPFKVQQKVITTSGIVTIPSKGFVVLEVENDGYSMKDAYAVLLTDNPLLKAENTVYIGNFEKGEKKILRFYLTCYAPPGSYAGYLVIKYKKFGDELVSPKLYVRLNVLGVPALRIVKATSNLAVGMDGEIDLKLIGNYTKAELYLLSPDESVQPLTSFSTVTNGTAKFRVKVSGNALPGYHRLYVVERFDYKGMKDLSSVAEFDVYVKPKTAYFQIVSVKSEGMYPDSTGTVYVSVKNAGTSAVYNAVVLLYVQNPLSIAGTSELGGIIGQSQPGTYFIGTLRPGEVKVAKFRVKVDKHAIAGSYPATVKIKYYDSQGYSYTSDAITISVEVERTPLINPLTLTAITLAIIGIAIGVHFWRKRAQ